MEGQNFFCLPTVHHRHQQVARLAGLDRAHVLGDAWRVLYRQLPPANEFIVAHNGTVANSAELRLILQKHGCRFESETDAEAVAILTKYVYDTQPSKLVNFTELVKTILKELEGSFAFVFKSIYYPNEIVTAHRGSPLLGVKTEKKLKVDFVDVEFSGDPSEAKPDLRESALRSQTRWPYADPAVAPSAPASMLAPPQSSHIPRSQSRAFTTDDGLPQPIEFFVASDAYAIVQHTKRALYLKGDDIAHIAPGGLHIHRLRRKEDGQQTPSQAALDRDAQDRDRGDHEVQVRPLRAEGDLRAARFRREHDARVRQLRQPQDRARRAALVPADHPPRVAHRVHRMRD